MQLLLGLGLVHGRGCRLAESNLLCVKCRPKRTVSFCLPGGVGLSKFAVRLDPPLSPGEP